MDKVTDAKKSDAVNLAEARKALDKSIAELELKKDTYEGLEDSLLDSFKAGLEASLSEDENDVILENNPVDIFEMMEAKRKIFVDDALAAEQEEIRAFEDQIEDEEVKLHLLETEQSFRSENPDLDVDGLVEYLKQDISPRKKAELLKAADGDNVKFLGLAAESYLESIGEGNVATPDVGVDISGVVGEIGDLDNGDGMDGDEDADYLAKIGLK